MDISKNKLQKSITAVIGLGKSGIAASKLLNAEGRKVVAIEQSTDNKYNKIAEELKRLGISVQLGKPFEIFSLQPWLNNISDVIVSPSVPWNHNTLNQLRDLKINTKGEIGLAWERLKDIPWIGITGTNGKTTVTSMLKYVLSMNKINAQMGGNIGNPACGIALELLKNQNNLPNWLIMELSSYQIESAEKISPEIGIWTTFTQDHLERHGTMENYFNIKKKLLEKSSKRIYNLDDKYLYSQKEYLKKGIWVTTNSYNIFNQQCNYWINKEGSIIEEGQELFHSSVLDIPGKHNLQNLLIVTAAARQIGLSAQEIEYGLTGFKGVPHRLEYIGEIKGIKVFNDSKATNYESSIVGLQSLNDQSILLAGGQAKVGDTSEWIKQLHKSTSGIFLFGASAKDLKDIIKISGYKKPVATFRCLGEAANEAFNMGIKIQIDNILLSPACASFDQYKDFEERGNHFKELFKTFQQSKENLNI